ncbi:NAD(P)/FAD-dependent oxidoreductase [Gordonia asplenii]|uniref:NAD(P)/FAD-dependent oxidoreductase n=1 Tax=Gordonia asplenii TaxID=2725283 RepID=UPI0028A757C9|nr:FAD-dependent oxidoreductase [Gordonia asplenii]
MVVGGSLAGLRCVEQLRLHGWTGSITVIGEEPYAPYNRPPLSKDALTRWSSNSPGRWAEIVALRTRAGVTDVSWRLGVSATRVDVEHQLVHLDDGDPIKFCGLVVATGVRPRRISLPGPTTGRHVLRTLDDARALAPRLFDGQRVVVLGAGFVGCEVAATAAAIGCRVTLVEPGPAPLARVLGCEIGAAVGNYQQSKGVRIRCGRTAVAMVPARSGGRVAAVALDDGTEVPADVVIEAVGSVPNVEWLDNIGIDITDGILCDRNLRAGGRPNIVAAGDIARVANPRFDDIPRRIEHWCMPAATARQAAASLASHLTRNSLAPASFAPLPTFWSDQFELRLQSFGQPFLGDAAHLVDGTLDRLQDGAIVHYTRAERLVGVVMTNIPANQQRVHRGLVDSACPAPEPDLATSQHSGAPIDQP